MDAFLYGAGMVPLQKVWSDEARAAAAEARARNAASSTHEGVPGEHSGAPANQSTQGGAESHMTAGRYGWEHEGESKHFPGEQEYSHPASNVKIQVKPSGEWRHGAIGGSSKNDLDTYLTHLHGRTQA